MKKKIEKIRLTRKNRSLDSACCIGSMLSRPLCREPPWGGGFQLEYKRCKSLEPLVRPTRLQDAAVERVKVVYCCSQGKQWGDYLLEVTSGKDARVREYYYYETCLNIEEGITGWKKNFTHIVQKGKRRKGSKGGESYSSSCTMLTAGL